MGQSRNKDAPMKCLLAACLALPAAAAPPPYRLAATISLGAPARWDYLHFDPASGHLLIAHGNHIDVFDPAAGQVISQLQGLDGAHAVAVAPSGNIYADSGQSGAITEFDGHSSRPIRTIATSPGADAMLYEPTHRLVAVMNGKAQTVTLIDAASGAVRATIPLGASPEFAAADGAGHIDINLESSRQIAVLNVATNHLTARYDIASCDSPHGMAIDPANRHIFTTCENKRLLVIDATSGTVLQTLPIDGGSDAAAFDPIHRLVFSSNGAGTLSIFHEATDGRLTARPAQPTEPGARTMATDPASGDIFLVTADRAAPPSPGHYPSYKPGTVRLLILTPQRH
jgi:YVTN family beta-propeller protein